MKTRAFMSLLFMAMLSACASDIPRPISESPPVTASVAEARTGIERLRGTPVRWGGKIAGVENHPSETWIDIVELPLNRYGRPQDSDRSGGRFIARIEGFLDPHVYTSGRQITVAGVLEKTLSRAIGEYPYTYPVVKAEAHYLWPPLAELPPRYYHDPYWYDPWYPWGYPPYPYYHPRFYR